MRISDWSSDVCSSDLIAELPRVEPVRIDAGVGRIADVDAKLDRAAEGGALRVGRLAVLAQIFLGPAFFGADIVDPGAVVDIHREPGAVRLRELERLLVEIGRAHV